MAGEILRPYAINTGSTISGTTQVGDIAIGENDTYDYSTRPGGVTWYMGPDENLGYLIVHPDYENNRPRFKRTSGFDDDLFLIKANEVASIMGHESFTDVTDAVNWMNLSGVSTTFGDWSSYWEQQWYGIQIDEANTSPDVTRIGSVMTEQNGTYLHAVLPVHAKLRACLLADNGTVNYYLDPTNWSKKADGTASALDGSDGQVMIEWPDFYYKVETDYPAAGQHQIKISCSPLAGFTLVPKHYVSAYEANIQRSVSKFGSFKNTGTDFRGGDNTSAWDAAANSLLGMPVTNINRTDGRTYARNRGAGWDQYGYNDHKWLFWFFAIEYATLNSQKAVNATLTAEGYKQGGLGNGVSTANGDEWDNFCGYNPFIACGASDALASGSGEVSVTKTNFGGAGVNRSFAVPRYRGHENPFGHILKICDGVNIDIKTVGDGNTSKLFVANNPSVWTDANYNGYAERGDIARANGYMSKALLGSGAEFVSSEAIGAYTTYYCDWFYTSITSTSMKMLLVGGNASGSVDDGFACSIANDGPSGASADVGFRTRFQGA